MACRVYYQSAHRPCLPRSFAVQVADMRGREKQLMFWNAVVKTINVTMVFGVPPLVLFAVLVPYELWHTDSTSLAPHVSPTTVFTMLSLFNILRFPLVVLPKAMRCVSEAIRATGNLQHFLAEPAAPRQDLEGKPGAQLSKVRCGVAAAAWRAADWLSCVFWLADRLLANCPPPTSLPCCLPACLPACLAHLTYFALYCCLVQAVLRHETDTSGFTLRVPEFSVKPGELVAVVGRVGSGKSSLLQALLGNMQTVSQLLRCRPSAVYCGRVELRPA